MVDKVAVCRREILLVVTKYGIKCLLSISIDVSVCRSKNVSGYANTACVAHILLDSLTSSGPVIS